MAHLLSRSVSVVSLGAGTHKNQDAVVAELVDALDLGSSEATRGGSSPPRRIV
jgi:hypothetical protein